MVDKLDNLKTCFKIKPSQVLNNNGVSSNNTNNINNNGINNINNNNLNNNSADKKDNLS
jgi:hypothetical protein